MYVRIAYVHSVIHTKTINLTQQPEYHYGTAKWQNTHIIQFNETYTGDTKKMLMKTCTTRKGDEDCE